MRGLTFARWLCGGAAALSLFSGATSALAQEAATSERGLALNRFNPAPAGDRMFGVQSPYAASPNQDESPTLHVMLLADYAHNPLVLRRVGGEDPEDLGAIVSNQLFLHLNGAFTLWDRLSFNLDLPFAVLQSGDSPTAEGLSFNSPGDAALGDLRLGVRVRLSGDYFDPIQFAIGGYVWVPTGNGDPGSYVGEGTVRGMPQLIAGGRMDSLVWSAAVGVDFRPAQTFQQVAQGNMIQGGGGIAWVFGPRKEAQVGPEISFSTVLDDASARSTNAELLVGGRYRFIPPVEAGLGVGPGLSNGIGTPDFRAVAMVAYTPEVKKVPKDRDRDGIVDEADACPDQPGVASPDPKLNGCPPPDRDSDGILDADDACPDEPGVANADPNKHGCPPPGDRDGDGITDDVDACPDVPGVASPDPKLNGCPLPDRDGDGVPDAQDACPDIPGLKSDDPQWNGCPGDKDGDTIRDHLDACPNEKGKPDPDPKKNGCPTAVRVTDQEIVILQQVQFDTGKATIRPVSDPLLDEVAGVVKEHPEILKLEVQGHTDSRGSKALNKRLSTDRAASVVAALVKRGVAADRLTSNGYGPDVPIADNKTAEGRQKNRRVQFKILEKKQAQPAQPAPAPAKPAPAQPAPAPAKPAPAQPAPAPAKPAPAKPAPAKPAKPAPAQPAPLPLMPPPPKP